MGPGMMGFGGMGIMMMLFWGLLLMGGVVFIIHLLKPDDSKKVGLIGSDDAVEILKQRYAKGEIDKVEFQSKMEDLRTIF